MKAIKRLHLMCGLLTGLLHVSCTQEMPEPAGNGSNGPVCFSIGTRAADIPENTTYRVMAYTAAEKDQYNFAKAGTYYWKGEVPGLPDDRQELTACSLDEDGWNPQDDPSSGLNGISGDYFVVFVSPGIMHNTGKDNAGSFSFVPTQNEFMASDPERKSLGVYGRQTMGTLKDRRAEVGINFYKSKNENVDDFEVRDLKLVGAGAYGEDVTLYPASKQVIVNKESAIDITLDEGDKSSTNDKGDYLYYSTAEEKRVHIASAIYAPLDKVAEILDVSYKGNLQKSDYLYMTCTLKQGSRDNIAIRMPLTATFPELLPMHTYVFNITVSSNYINATVDVFGDNDWQDGGANCGTIAPPETIELGTWEIVGTEDGGWEVVEIPGQSIQ